MQQHNYETIIACIAHGAAATKEAIIADFNQTVQQANTLLQLKAEQERKEREVKEAADAAVREEARKAAIAASASSISKPITPAAPIIKK